MQAGRHPGHRHYGRQQEHRRDHLSPDRVFGANEDLEGKSYTGREFDALTTTQEKLEAVSAASLFSRVEPSHKSQLVICSRARA